MLGLRTGVNLVDDGGTSECRPVLARLGQVAGNRHFGDLVGLLEDVDIETLRDVPSNVAVEGPRARVIKINLNGKICRSSDIARGTLSGREELHITADRVVGLSDRAVPSSETLREDVEAVTVHMHRVDTKGPVVIDDKLDALRVAGVVNVPLGWEGGVAKSGLEERRVVVVTTEGRVVHEPDEVGAVGTELHVDVLDNLRGRGSLTVERLGDIERVVGAGQDLGARDSAVGGGDSVSVRTLIVNTGKSDRRDTVGERATDTWRPESEIGAHPVGRALSTDTLNDNIGTLTDTKSDDVGGVGNNGDEIVGNDSELMSIDRELLYTLSGGVDEAEEMLLARLELELGETSVGSAGSGGVGARVVILALDQVVVGEWWRVGACVHGLVDEDLVVGVIPIAEDDRTHVNVVRLSLRTVDNNGTKSTTRVLSRVMGVVPGGAVELSLEAVGEGLARSNWALLDSGSTIIVRSTNLEETVPVKGGSVRLEQIGDSHLNPITPVGLDERTGELAVYNDTGLLNTIGSNGLSRNREVVLARNASVWPARVGVGAVGGVVRAPRVAIAVMAAWEVRWEREIRVVRSTPVTTTVLLLLRAAWLQVLSTWQPRRWVVDVSVATTVGLGGDRDTWERPDDCTRNTSVGSSVHTGTVVRIR